MRPAAVACLAALPAVLALVAPSAPTPSGRAASARHRRARPSHPATRLSGIKVDAWAYKNGMQDPKMALPNGIDPKAFPSPVPFDLSTVPGALEALERDGVCHIPGVLNAEWLAYLRDCTEWQIEHPHVWASPGVVSGLYDYIQRSVWTTNEAFAQFMYRSPIGSVLAAVGQTPEIRITTDLLMVNPNKGFKWHQDNQNGPVEFESALRWWVTMDETPPDHGAPVYLAGSQNNDSVDPLQVFVDLEEGDLPQYADKQIKFRPKAGDMIIWNAKTIHKIDGPKSQDWGKSKRRVLGGTAAVAGATYSGEGRALFSDLGSHAMRDGDVLAGKYWPRIYPSPVPDEYRARANGEVARTNEGILRMMGNMVNSLGEMASWTNVVKKEKKPEGDEELEAEEASEAAPAGRAKAEA